MNSERSPIVDIQLFGIQSETIWSYVVDVYLVCRRCPCPVYVDLFLAITMKRTSQGYDDFIQLELDFQLQIFL